MAAAHHLSCGSTGQDIPGLLDSIAPAMKGYVANAGSMGGCGVWGASTNARRSLTVAAADGDAGGQPGAGHRLFYGAAFSAVEAASSAGGRLYSRCQVN